MSWTATIKRTAVVILSAAMLTVTGLGMQGATSVAAGAAAPACGSGDHGLLQKLQAEHSGVNAVPLSFTDIQFLTADTGRAAGNGFLIGTSDRGCHFQKIYEGQWNFRQIDFPDNVKGWALAAIQDAPETYLIATTDGGSHWKRVTDKGVTFERIHFQDSKRGFGYSQSATYYTKDGGKSWSRIPTPANTRGAEFTSRNNGWAVVAVQGTGYRVMKTSDGGQHWKISLKSTAAYPVGGRIYAQGSQVYALLYGDTGMSQTSYALYASSTSGGSWKRVIAMDTAGGGPAPGSGAAQLTVGPAAGKPGNMQLIGSSNAYLLGYSPAGEQVAVGRSYNGGKSWKNLAPVAGYDGVISFPEAKRGWMAVRGPEHSVLLFTEDGGATWKQKFAFKDTQR
ncbi:YCF48-related protein [Paenibacillus borealis]|uniref:Photosynthesis system II assembly factor Ycf48/Hcf136-like domain-containing protein n=1 Tax=Paenibacillus borealis TaxID=160799 RepID=A0A089L6A7_PAEBO|nr:YCF48-related protein [Paenibacillus borealis]AIQ55635.1 hypothetical protein PBOR_00540 [Paenibacillus borealis]